MGDLIQNDFRYFDRAGRAVQGFGTSQIDRFEGLAGADDIANDLPGLP